MLTVFSFSLVCCLRVCSGHYTVYNKTIVFYPEKLVLGKNVYCKKYLGGNGVDVWNPLSSDQVNSYKQNKLTRDIFVTMGPMNRAVTSTSWLSMSGKMPSSLAVDAEVAKLVWYPGCTGLATYWDWQTDMKNYANSQYKSEFESGERRFNFICLQEFMKKYDPATGTHSRFVESMDHWGKGNTYPCRRDVLDGHAALFSNPGQLVRVAA